MLTIAEIKDAVKSNTAVGKQFTNAAGSVGTVLTELSGRGKPLAEMSCTKQGCTATHKREISDWHQSHRCKDHPANRSGKSKKGPKKTDEDQRVELAKANEELLKYAKDNNHELPSDVSQTLAATEG